MKKPVCCFLFAITIFILYPNTFCCATEVIIRGNNPDYAGKILDLLVYKNRITYNEKIISSTTVDQFGDFKWKFDTNETTYVFVKSGIFHLFLFTEPGNLYTVKLPPFKAKTKEDELNPYFQESRVHILIKSVTSISANKIIQPNSELNFLIRSFDDYFDPFYTKYAIKLYTKQQIDEMDSIIGIMDNMFMESNNTYFHSYYMYRIGLMKFTSTRFKSKYISNNYFLNQPVLYNNPAYMELFNQVYNKYFVFYGRSETGKNIYADINSNQSLSGLYNTLQQDSILENDTLMELVVLKGLYDGFYEMDFSRSALLVLLDSLTNLTKIKIHAEIGMDIRDEVTKLLAGHIPPSFKLYDMQNKLVSLDDFKGSYVYLCFCTTQNYACIKDMEQLKRIQEKFNKHLKIVYISFDDSLSSAENFIRRKNYKWIFLHYGNQPEIIRDYDIRIFPSYYLIDREGKLLLSPAPAPEENFELKFFEELRDKRLL